MKVLALFNTSRQRVLHASSTSAVPEIGTPAILVAYRLQFLSKYLASSLKHKLSGVGSHIFVACRCHFRGGLT